MRLGTKSCMIAVSVAAALLAGCAAETPAPPGNAGLFGGESIVLGNGAAVARSYIINDEQGIPRSLGVMISQSFVNEMPSTPQEYVLPLPATLNTTPFKDIVLDWLPQGHAPAPYQVAQFNVRFFTVPESGRDNFTSANLPGVVQAPPATTVPLNFQPLDGLIPGPGVDWVDKNAPELHGQTFTRSLAYTYAFGQLDGLSIMLSQSFLAGLPNTTNPVPVPSTFVTPGVYPLQYSVISDNSAGMYRIELEQLTSQQ